MLLETTALLLHRIGREAVSDFPAKVVPLLEIVRVDWLSFEETGFTLAAFHGLDALRSSRPARDKKA